jgi:DNA-binding IclR family transcriptional regulator
VSVPIFQRANQAVASITLMAPSTRAAQRPDALIEMTVAAARRITSKLQVH